MKQIYFGYAVHGNCNVISFTINLHPKINKYRGESRTDNHKVLISKTRVLRWSKYYFSTWHYDIALL
jgi:hypothetical protein